MDDPEAIRRMGRLLAESSEVARLMTLGLSEDEAMAEVLAARYGSGTVSGMRRILEYRVRQIVEGR